MRGMHDTSLEIPADAPEDGWPTHDRAVELYCTQCHMTTYHVPGPKGYVKREA